jgi:hypothetical protein
MKTVFKSIIGCSVLIMVIASCHRDRLKLKPIDARPVKSIEVADSDEAELLQQEVGLEIRQLQGARLYYFVKDKAQDQRLIDLGYETKDENLMQINYQVVQISLHNKAPDSSKADELLKYEIVVINKEEAYWIVRGPLEQLNRIQELNYKIKIPEKEVRPREVVIVVPAYADIQKVNELGVDIYSSEKNKRETITIYAGAFDYQIEKMRSMGYQVTRTK